MTTSRGRLRAAALVLAALGCASCGDGNGEDGRNRILRVPEKYRTIQAAVDAADPGDLVLIRPGVYHEDVTVSDERERIVIRGLDRNRVVLDGRDRLGDGIAVHADGVAVENLTVRRYLVNGVVWSPAGASGGGRPLQGWRGSYITAYNNGLYGVYAFGAQHGRFDHVYASGHPDSGVYVGACNPCHALVRDSAAERNHVGYEATNASGDMKVLGSVWRRNRVGVQINSLRKERGFPQRGSVLRGNRIVENQERGAPRGSQGFGAGVVVNGGRGNLVADNAVAGHAAVGIFVLDSPDSVATDNSVQGNRLNGNAVDLALQAPGGRSEGNCFAANRSARGGPKSVPAGLQALTGQSCQRSVAVSPGRLPLVQAPPQVDYRTVPAPPPQSDMRAAATAPAKPAVGSPEQETEG
jgi:Right handed beta helix region